MMKARLVVVATLGLVMLPSLLSAEPKKVTVVAGQTLYSIAKDNGVTVDALKAANNISDPSKIKLGQVISIPETSQPVSSTKPATNAPQTTKALEPGKIIVKAGDTLFGLAKQHGLTVDDLRFLNKIGKNDVLRIGQVLLVPGAESPLATPAVAIGKTPAPASTPQPTNVVKVGGDGQRIIAPKDLTWPVAGEIYSQLGSKFPGVMIKAARGDAVRSLTDGKVTYVNPHATWGLIVMIAADNGYTYVYCGNETVKVQNGALVRRGDELGRVGISPGTDQAQAFLSVWKDGNYVDPVKAPR